MNPPIELAVQGENPNTSVLAPRFPLQLELVNGYLIIKDPDYAPEGFADGNVTVTNEEHEQLIMWPKEERWFIRKGQGLLLGEEEFSFCGLTLSLDLDENPTR